MGELLSETRVKYDKQATLEAVLRDLHTLLMQLPDKAARQVSPSTKLGGVMPPILLAGDTAEMTFQFSKYVWDRAAVAGPISLSFFSVSFQRCWWCLSNFFHREYEHTHIH